MIFIKRTNWAHCTDEELIQAIAKGNTAAFEVLYERYSAPIFRFFYRMLWQNTALSEDFTQDIFLKIIEKPQLFDTQRCFKSWIYTTAANKCKNAYRDKKDIQSIDNQVFEYRDNTILKLDLCHFEGQLMDTINTLESTTKECFVLRYLEDMPVKDIATIVGIPEGTVKSKLHYAVKKMAGQLAWGKDILE